MSLLLEIQPAVRRTYVVGDIHGCQSELEVLISHLEKAEGLTPADRLVFLGDYVDRGPDSKGVISTLIDFKGRFKDSHFLRGNHEEMLLSYLGLGGTMGEIYFANGGVGTITSYGGGREISSEDARALVPEAHLQFFNSLQYGVIDGDWVLVHAGLDPLRTLHTQTEEDLLWIRDEFIFNIHFFERTIIFGHTPFEDVLFRFPYKIGIDTGLVFGNRLSCLELKEKKVLQVKKGSSEVLTRGFPKE